MADGDHEDDEIARALLAADGALASIPAALRDAALDTGAFGKLFEANALREAYQERLPATEAGIAKARAGIDALNAALDDPA